MTKRPSKVGYIALPLVIVAALAAGCQPGGENDEASGVPGDTAGSPSAAASPTAPAPNTREICDAVLQVFLDGSTKIADDSVKAIENGSSVAQQAKQLKATLGGMAAEIEPQAVKATDPEVKKLVAEIAAGLESGAKSSDVHDFLDKKLVPLGTRIDKECVA